MWYGLFPRCTGQAQECDAVTKVREVADSVGGLTRRLATRQAQRQDGAASSESAQTKKKTRLQNAEPTNWTNNAICHTSIASPRLTWPFRSDAADPRPSPWYKSMRPTHAPQRRQPNAVAAIEKEGAVQHHRCPWPHRHRHRIVEQKKNMPLSAADAPDAAVPPPRGKDDGQKKQAPTSMAVDERPTRDPCFQSPLFSPASPAWASPSHWCTSAVPTRPSFVAGNWAGGGKLRSKLNTLGGHARGQGRACQTSAGPATEHQGTGASPKQKPGSRDRASSSQARPLRRGRRRHHHARRHRQPTTTFGRGAEAARTSGRPVARVTNGPVNLPIWKTPLSRRKQRGPAKHAGEPSRPGRASVAVFESPVPDPKHSPPSPGQGQPNGSLRRSTLFLKGERHGPGDAPRTPPGFAERASFHRLTADMTGLLCLRLRPTRPSSESSCGRQPTDHFQTTRFSHEPLLVDGTDSTAHPLPESWFCPSRTTLDDFVWV
ncbi:hypothetical protein PCL_00233 [Purpureocillium lilacinum]|uniref:Uncharacterized protein n=1 Tax=Purpureocillium lilacinum TaxID=33203 RepID=A0A2U3E6J2_PURLI|nr:hypothetical protein PCL_00233 [Purpureocillium lilacinum]